MRRLLFTLTAFLLLSAPAQASWSWPVRGDVITPYRNGADPYAGGQHRGIDIAAAVGTAVVAAAGGEVRFAGTAGSSGLTVSVRTGDGFDTSYLHLSALAVRAGARVSAGERLGAVGTTGTRSADQPHLHFGVREAGTRHAYIDPLSMLPPAAAPPPRRSTTPGTGTGTAGAESSTRAARRAPAGTGATWRPAARAHAPRRAPAGTDATWRPAARAPRRATARTGPARRAAAGARPSFRARPTTSTEDSTSAGTRAARCAGARARAPIRAAPRAGAVTAPRRARRPCTLTARRSTSGLGSGPTSIARPGSEQR